MYGFSIISYIEIFYYLSGKWFVHYYRAYKSVGEPKKRESQHEVQLNWKELLPRGVKQQQLDYFM